LRPVMGRVTQRGCEESSRVGRPVPSPPAPICDRMLMTPCDSVRNLGVRADNAADGSGAGWATREAAGGAAQGVDQIPEGPSARLTGELRAVARAPARSSPDARPDPYRSRSSHGGGSCRGATPTFGIPAAEHDAGALSSGDSGRPPCRDATGPCCRAALGRRLLLERDR